MIRDRESNRKRNPFCGKFQCEKRREAGGKGDRRAYAEINLTRNNDHRHPEGDHPLHGHVPEDIEKVFGSQKPRGRHGQDNAEQRQNDLEDPVGEQRLNS